MRKIERVTINGKEFEIVHSKNRPGAPVYGCNRDEIFEVYARPSRIKELIWYDWANWCYELNTLDTDCGLEISGHNSNFFTIRGTIITPDRRCDLYITASHNRLIVYEV